MKILKPAASTSSFSIKLPADLGERLAAAQAAASERGLILDIATPLSKALVRLVKQAEAELNLTYPPGQENPPEPPAGALVASENFDSGEQS